MPDTSVLIVGAGPTGLVLALSLAKRSIPFRIVSAANGPGEHSRAMVVQARTLEFYQQFGFAEEMIGEGVKVNRIRLREQDKNGSHEAVSVAFADLGEGLSPFPFPLCYSQDNHERFLVKKLEALGVTIEWNTKLISFAERKGEVHAELQKSETKAQQMTASYICGCDGAHSVVRSTLSVGFPGGTYEQMFYVADVVPEQEFKPELEICLGEKVFVLTLPVRSSGMQRLIGVVPIAFSEKQDITWDDIRADVEPLITTRVKSVNWFATYRVHHRVAEHFRVGRAFLLGDAGHIHSPAGGQGMNTGIGDAINLGWKLCEVLHGNANASLLDTYESERIGFARSLVETTDRAFTSIVAPGVIGEAFRRYLMPMLMNVATKFGAARHAAFRVISQTKISYQESALSSGKAGGVLAGDRLPWVQFDSNSNTLGNYAPLSSLAWQVHVYGSASSEFESSCAEFGVPLHQFAYNAMCKDVGFEEDAIYLVRPDGHIGMAASKNSAFELDDYADRLGLNFH